MKKKDKKKKISSKGNFEVGNKNRFYLIGLIVIIALGAFLRIYKLGANSLWSDEIRQVMDSLWRPRNLSELNYWAALAGQPPLDYIVLRFFARNFGMTEFFFRLPSAIWGILSIFVIYKLANLLFGRKEALLSAFLLSISLPHLQYSQDVRLYSLGTLLFLISFFFLYSSLIRNKRIYYLGLVVSTSLALYTHNQILLLVFIEFLFICFLLFLKNFHKSEKLSLVRTKNLKMIIFCLLFCFLLYLPQLKFLLTIAQRSGQLAKDKFTLLFEGVEQFPVELLAKIYLIFGSALSYIPPWSGIWTPPELSDEIFLHFLPYFYFLVVILGLFYLRKENISQFFLAMSFLIIFPIIQLMLLPILGGGTGRPGVYHFRHTVFILPVYLIIVSKGALIFSESFFRVLTRFFNLKEKSTYGTILILIMFFGSFHFPLLKKYFIIPQKEEWSTVTDYIVRKIPVGDRVVFEPNWCEVNYFFYLYRNYGGRGKNINPENPKNIWRITAYGEEPGDSSSKETTKNFVLVEKFPGYIFLWLEK